MDNPLASRASFFGLRRLAGSSSELSSIKSSEEEDTLPTPLHFKHKSKHHGGYFSRHIKMTPLESSSRKPAKAASHADAVRESYMRECERWYVTNKLNKHEKATDPLTYGSTRLDAFLQYYDTILEGAHADKKHMEGKEDRIGFWSCQAMKLLTGMEHTITIDVLADFSNNQAKKSQKMKVLYLMSGYFATQWSWLLALDNIGTEFYCYTLAPTLYTGYSEYRSTIGPSNHHILHGDSMSNLPFSKESFSSVVCFDFWLHLKSDDWVPVLSEISRILSPGGQLCLLLMDFTVINCTNEIYTQFFQKVQDILVREGIDPYPCKKAQGRMVEAGFQTIRYSILALKKGIPGKLGSAMELVQSFFEYVIFTKIAQLSLSDDELELFKEMRVQYSRDCRNGELIEGLGDSYFMLLLSEKSSTC